MADKKKSDELYAAETQPGNELARGITSPAAVGAPKPGSPGGPPFQVAGKITLTRSEVALTDDHALWSAIRNRTEAIRGDRYIDFIDRVLCHPGETGPPVCNPGTEATPTNRVTGPPRDIGASIETRRGDLFAASGYGVDAYNLLKLATQA